MTSQESQRSEPIPIDPENVTPQMWNHAMHSPGNRAALDTTEAIGQASEAAVDAAKTAVEAAGVQLDTSSAEVPKIGPMTAKEYVQKADDEAGKNGVNKYDRLFDPEYQSAVDTLSDSEVAAMASPEAERPSYTPSASIGKTWEQVKGVQDALDAQRVAEGKEPQYYSSQQPK